MTKFCPLRGIIFSIVDERGPYPKAWYPDFTELGHIHNSAVKSFSIMIGDKSYREKSLRDLTCFGILPFPDIDAIGFIHFFGVENPNKVGRGIPELPMTITLLFEDTYRDELCKKCPRLYAFLEGESEALWAYFKNGTSDNEILSVLFIKVQDLLEI
ncbi:MAG: hypothetical protein ACTSQI_17650 [Candidatus Helarchaeota archaeon]